MKRFANIIGVLALYAAIASGLIVLAGAVAARFHWTTYEVGFNLITLHVGMVFAHIAAVIAVAALLFAFADFKRFGLRALIAVVIAGAVLGGFIRFHFTAHGTPPVHDVSTNWEDPVALSGPLMDARKAATNPVENDPRVPASRGAPWGGMRVADVNAKTCPGAKPILHGVDADRVAKVLQDNDVQVVGSQIFRVEGVYEGFWFGAKDDVVVRIRPERTDVRSIRRDGLSDYGANCARVTSIVQALSK